MHVRGWLGLMGALGVLAFESASTATDEAVLVELFTSQGCSSCPPADEVLSELGQEADVIALSFHVDYWNHLGWKDVFSSPQWSARQRAYASALPVRSTYTPQVVVQGQQDCVGSNLGCIREALERARARGRTAEVRIQQAHVNGESIRVQADTRLSSGAPDVVVTVVVFESGLSTAVRRGENRGRRLDNDFVVRTLREVGLVRHGDTRSHRTETEIALGNEWMVENLGVVVFLQDPASRRVLGAATAGLENPGDTVEVLPEDERVPKDRVALDGHCPVALIEAGRLVRGSPTLQYRYQGVVYQMTNAAAAAKFARQPARYVPPFSTFDPVRYSETREKTTGALDVFTLHEGRPWFFLNAENKARFLKSPEPFVRRALAR